MIEGALLLHPVPPVIDIPVLPLTREERKV
jgi:hypothetical protein